MNHKGNIKTLLITFCTLIIGVSIGVGIMFFYTKNNLVKEKVKPIIKKDDNRKQELTKLDDIIFRSKKNSYWFNLYYLMPSSFQTNVTYEQYLQYNSKRKLVFAKETGQIGTIDTELDKFDPSVYSEIVSMSYVINSILINGNMGGVDKTISYCLKADCLGVNRIEINSKELYEYKSGKWQLINLNPSEKSMIASSYIFTNIPNENRKELIEQWGQGYDSLSYATLMLAIEFDNNPVKLSNAEAWIEKHKVERSKPVVNYQPPNINIEQAPQTQTFPKNCITNTVGSYTYTNCY